MTPIDWQLLANAESYYKSLGYKPVDVPWIVSKSVSEMTFNGRGIICDLGNLVGSGEQGFLVNNYPSGLYQTITPCFREETNISDSVRSYFIKLELYSEDIYPNYKLLLNDAFSYLSNIVECRIIKTTEGHDIVSGELELGSYGARSMEDRHWVYGTGVALPRISIAKNDTNNKRK